MIDKDDLKAAVALGILDEGQATRLADLAATRRASPGSMAASDSDDERFRLIGGFSDVFVTIGVVLLAAALFGLAEVLGFRQSFLFVGILVAWGLAEVFSRRLRLALPSIVLALMFAGAVGALVLSFVTDGFHGGFAITRSSDALPFALPGLAVAAAGYLHDRRFRVPIDGAITALGLLAVAWALLVAFDPLFAVSHLAAITAVLGLGVFAAAMAFDMSDPLRKTRRSDAGFWLHLLAAPLIVHPLVTSSIDGVSTMKAADAWVVLAVFVLLSVVAIAVDRRALLVSALGYAGFAMAYLIGSGIASQGLKVPLTLLGLAVVVLGLSAGWRRLRAIVVPLLPLGRFATHLPPIARREPT